MWLRLLPLTLAEWRHHPWRHGVALLAVALGVALAASVQMINASALAEFGQAVRSVNGQPDQVLLADAPEGFDARWFSRLATDEAVASASPLRLLEVQARSRPDATPVALRLVGVDALQVWRSAPELLPRPQAGRGPAPADEAARAPHSATARHPTDPAADPAAGPATVADAEARTDAAAPDAAPDAAADLLAADRLYLNRAARERLGLPEGQAATLWLRHEGGWQPLRVAGAVTAGGPALAVADLAAVQALAGDGRLSRVDLQLVPGTDPAAWSRTLALPPGLRLAAPDEAAQRVSNLSRAYRVNLGVLAAVALLVGAFLVYSVVSLSVAQRTPQLALLGVLGLAAADRRRWLLAESGLLGLAGSAAGLGAGAALAALALRALGGDLGGGYFTGLAPPLQAPPLALVLCFALGTLATVAGAWWPARQAGQLQPAQALKGLGPVPAGAGLGRSAPAGLALLAAGGLAALAPPVAGLPLAAYAAVALLLAGGVVLVPVLVALLLRPGGALARQAGRSALRLLALRRAHHARQGASAMVAGVVASLALSVAITVMVASFREAVIAWLDQVLPADLYLRSAGGGALPPGLAASAAALPGVARVQGQRARPLVWDPQQPPLTLLARPLGADAAAQLPLLGPARPVPPGVLAVWASEPAAALYRLAPGSRVQLPLGDGAPVPAQVAGIWRDYARQFGALLIDQADYQRLTGDSRLSDLALWLAPGAEPGALREALAALAPAQPLELAGTGEIRALSLRIFDRSFAVTVYLQAVAIGVGLVGVAASLSAQVLARRKEFGLLAHLGLARAQVLRLVAAETATWLGVGVLTGLLLGLAMALVLVKVVNPQSFHWSMPLSLPVTRLLLLCAAVMAAGTLTAAWSARRAAARQAVLAVKEDW